MLFGIWERHRSPGSASRSTSSPTAFVDWLVAAIVALGGVLAVFGGSALAFLVDREMIAEEIQREAVTVEVFFTELDDGDATVVADALVSWMGIGLLVVGAGMVLFAIGYLVYRHRKRGRYGAEPESIPSYGTFALVGALVASILSFIPFATVLGGAVAGYLERIDSRRTTSVGALSGILPLVPILGLGLFLLVGVADGMFEIGEPDLAWFSAVAVVFAALFALIVAGGLGAIGGYLGGWLAERSEDRERRTNG